jgi:phage terminase large subunit GpA-like protein
VTALLTRLARTLRPPERLTTTEWARRYRGMSAKATAKPGRYNPDVTPWVAGMHQALDDPTVSEVVAMKSAQIAWTDGVILNYVLRRIDIEPCPMIVMFAKDEAAKQFNDEKFTPAIEATPRLGAKIRVDKLRDRDNRAQFKNFDGGFLKLVSSRSPSSVKSSPVPVVIVEEPDDADANLRGQGDSITLLVERTKSFPQRKVVFGGTPTISGLSRVESAFARSDQRRFWVPCHHCNEAHVLAWENVTWLRDAPVEHEVYGRSRPETAVYVCPHCGGTWSDAEKNRNVRRAEAAGHGWLAGAPFRGTAGFAINELYSPFPGSVLAELADKYLVAAHELARGEDNKMRSFVNNTQGLPYSYRTELPAADELAKRAQPYLEGTVPDGGLVLTAGVDVQHDRIAVVVRAWGRGEESWLVLWMEIYGSTLIPMQGAWVDLEQVLFHRAYPSEIGGEMYVRAVSIDTSDGQTSDAGYSFVRKWQGRGALAVKGASEQGADREIFSPPRQSADTDRKGKAWKYGLRPYMVGTQRAKDLLLGVDAGGGRIKLTGTGPGRLHWYEGVRADYWEQLLAEVKAPSSAGRHRKVWVKKSGARNEALDCEVYALHAARSLKTHLMREDQWALLAERMRQADLLAPALPGPAVEAQAVEQAPRAAPRRPGGFVKGWRN